MRDVDGNPVLMADECKVACNTCLRDSAIKDSRPIGCALDTATSEVSLYPQDVDDNSVFWDGGSFAPICKSSPCGSTRSYEDEAVYATSREMTSICRTNARARQEQADERWVDAGLWHDLAVVQTPDPHATLPCCT